MEKKKMNVTIGPRGVLEITDARLIFKNFRGLQTDFNDEGDRNFCVLISGGIFDDGRDVYELDAEGMADALKAQENRFGIGWNVKVKVPKNPDSSPYHFLKVKVNFNDRGPRVYVRTSERARPRMLDEETVGMLDRIDILSTDLTIRPFDGEARMGAYRSAYLQSIDVLQDIDHIAARYAAEEYPED